MRRNRDAAKWLSTTSLTILCRGIQNFDFASEKLCQYHSVNESYEIVDVKQKICYEQEEQSAKEK
jgi:hypothetical protein